VTNKAAAIANAALAQVGRYQDCTMLVTNSLKSVGITFHDWPIGYLSLGRQVSMAEAVPGDLLYYVNGAGTSVAGLAHIAVYIGNGKAVHGGFNGNETVIWSVNVGYGAGTPPTAVVRVA
jgi:cell wall-associated NlpC family hydrolase